MRRTFKPTLTRPEDFDVFWDSTRRRLERVDPAIEQRPLVVHSHGCGDEAAQWRRFEDCWMRLLQRGLRCGFGAHQGLAC